MKKIISILMACLLVATSVVMLVACTPQNNVVKDGKTINIKLYKGGYGTEWLEKLIEKFEAAYASEGYKVNLLKPSTDNHGSTIVKELASGINNVGVDLYFTGDFPVRDVVNGDYGLLVEDLTDIVYNQKAIGFDGKEEDKTVAEKLTDGYDEYWYQVDGKKYNFFYEKAVGGMVVNTKKLNSFGLTIPKTTNELIACINTIYNKAVEDDNMSLRPITFIGAGNNGYPGAFVNALYAQYQGIDGWNSFWSMNDSNGEYRLTDGYEVYHDQGILEMMKVIYNVYDYQYATNGSANQGLAGAHAQMMKSSVNSGAVFMCDGDWMYNEVSTDYDNLSDIMFINFPVISALGTKLWGSKYDETKCDKILSAVVSMSDEGKTPAEIVSAVKADASLSADITEEEALTVCKARGIYNNRGTQTGGAYITKDSPVKDIAALFLRMFASEDNSALYRELSNGLSPYDASGNIESDSAYLKGVSTIVSHPYATGIWPYATGLRSMIGQTEILPQYGGTLVINIFQQRASDYNSAAEARWNNEYEFAKSKWADWTKGLK